LQKSPKEESFVEHFCLQKRGKSSSAKKEVRVLIETALLNNSTSSVQK